MIFPKRDYSLHSNLRSQKGFEQMINVQIQGSAGGAADPAHHAKLRTGDGRAQRMFSRRRLQGRIASDAYCRARTAPPCHGRLHRVLLPQTGVGRSAAHARLDP